MAAPSKKLIVIIGVTGNQGSSVAKTFLATGDWRVRGVTRNPNGAAAQQLQNLGVELFQADLSDRDALYKAFEGAHAAFANTDFWTVYFQPGATETAAKKGQSLGEYCFDVEVGHGKNIADAAAATPTLERFIYSSLPAVDKEVAAEISPCYHWEAKVVTMEYISSTHPGLADKLSTIYLAAYATNAFIIPRWDIRSKSYKIMAPMRPEAVLPSIDPPNSTGPYVKALVDSEPTGTHLLAYDTNSSLTMAQYAEIWSRVSNLHVVFENTSVDYMAEQFGVPREILAGPVLIDRFTYMNGVEGFIEPPQLKSKTLTVPYETWLESHWEAILPPKTA